jgi:NADP-dependent 3-hydroxy acid dehydrogenase YdfG
MTSASTPVSTQREPELVGQTVVVIGGSAGIGLETARHARAEGADVILTGRNPDRLTQAAPELGAQRSAAFDANDAAPLERFVQNLPTPIDHVMVTAGGRATGPCSRWTHPGAPGDQRARGGCWRSRSRATPPAR